MREIEFRYVALHKKGSSQRIMTNVLNLYDLEDCCDIEEHLSELFSECTCYFSESQSHCDCESVFDIGEFKIISKDQYTGLKDCNGVKIFEGDILEFDWRYQDSGELYADDCKSITGVISWCCGKFVCRYFNNILSFDAGDINQATFERFWRDDFNGASEFYKMTGFKVIGNIHETK